MAVEQTPDTKTEAETGSDEDVIDLSEEGKSANGVDDLDDIVNDLASGGNGAIGDGKADILTGSPNDKLVATAKNVLARLEYLSIMPTPKNFEEFLLTEMAKLDDEAKDEIFSTIFIPNENNNVRINFENKVISGFDYLKDILKIVAVIYKNMNVISQITQKRSEECENTHDKAIIQNILSSLQQDISSLTKVTNKQMNQIKSLYQKIVINTTNIEKSTIYDKSMNVYNKQFFTDKTLEFQELVKENDVDATLVFMKLSKRNIIEIKKQERLKTILKNIAKLIKSIKKQNDIIAYYGNGIFSLILKDCDIEKAEGIIKTILINTSRTSFFLNDKEINLDIKFGITNITKDDLANTINKGIKALNQADSEKDTPYIISETPVEKTKKETPNKKEDKTPPTEEAPADNPAPNDGDTPTPNDDKK